MPSSITQYYWITLSRIVQNSSLLANKPGPYLSPSVVDHPLRPTKDHQLGKLLPYQQPNPVQAHLKTALSFMSYRCKALFKTTIIQNFKVDSCILLTYPLCLKNIQLACVKYTASVHPEPGSNSLFL